jgi:pilus assembly protein CpaE
MAEKILLIDDDLETLRLVGLLLQHQGYEIIAAQTGSEGLGKARTDQPDLILLDIIMPDMDGIEVCRRLRGDPATAQVPVIMFTAKDKVEHRVAAFQAGAVDFITKPVHPTELTTRVAAVLLRTTRRTREEVATAEGKVFGFLGAKGGVGTTTVATNVAVALAGSGADDRGVILAELRSGLAAASLQLGLQGRQALHQLASLPVEDLTPAIVEKELAAHESGLRVLTGEAEPPGVALPLTAAQGARIVEGLSRLADCVVLDLGIGLDGVNRQALARCYHVVVVIEPQEVALRLAERLLDAIVAEVGLGRHLISLVMVTKGAVGPGVSKTAVEERLKHELVGVIPAAAELMSQSAGRRGAVVTTYPDSAAGRGFLAVAEFLRNV